MSRPSNRPADPGLITKMLSLAIGNYDAGRISREHLLKIFQDAIDNGDILEPDNELPVVAAVLPLVDGGLLHYSEHMKTFEGRMDKKVLDFLAERRERKNT